MDELWDADQSGVSCSATSEPKKFPKQIAFNLIPFIDVFMEDGYTDEEAKMWSRPRRSSTRRSSSPSPACGCRCSSAIPRWSISSSRTRSTPDEARDILRNAPGCMVIDKHEPGGYVTPYEATGEFAVFVSRIRKDPTVENGLSMWVVSDNLRKGAALNAVQIAETLIKRKLITAKQKAA